ncbi:MAG TPA: hypothetical protein VLJ61_12590 [Pyrinomonadaceae bacterium]|nr:hypothetical protein [Pyrinomonadaceae bacterium]
MPTNKISPNRENDRKTAISLFALRIEPGRLRVKQVEWPAVGLSRRFMTHQSLAEAGRLAFMAHRKQKQWDFYALSLNVEVKSMDVRALSTIFDFESVKVRVLSENAQAICSEFPPRSLNVLPSSFNLRENCSAVEVLR